MNLYDKPVHQEFHLEGVKHISPEEAYQLISENKIFLIDVREESEFRAEYLDFDNVFFHPMSVIMERLAFIPKEIPLVVVCNEGFRSVKVANLLSRQGYGEVASLDGGLEVWAAKGYPLVVNEGYGCGSGCGCGEDDDDLADNSGCGCGCSGCH